MNGIRAAILVRLPSVAVIALAALSIGATAGLIVARNERARLSTLRRIELDALADDVASDVRSRVERYESGLRGIRGAILAAGPELSRERLRVYGESRDIGSEFPGALGFGFARRVPVRAMDEFVARVRRERPEGFDVRSFAAHDRDRIVIEHLVPEQPNRAALGLDLASDPVRERAALDAERTGLPTLTAPLQLVQATEGSAQGALFFLPIYRTGTTPPPELRPAQLVGWAYAPLSMPTVLRCVNNRCQDYRIAVRDLTDPSDVLAYRSPGFREGINDERRALRRIAVFGRLWRIEVQATPVFALRDHALPSATAGWLAALTATLSSALVLGALLYLQRRRRAEAQLRASEERFRDLAQSVPAMVWTCDADGALDYASPQWIAFTGVEEREQLGAGWLAQVHPDDRAELEREWTRAVQTGQSYEGQFRIRRSDRAYRWFQTRAVPIRDARGRAQRWYGSSTDIEALREVQAELRALNERLEQRVQERTHALGEASALQREILSAAGSAIIATDLQGTITIWNQAAERLLGYRADEVVGRHTPALVHEADEVRARRRELEATRGPLANAFEVFVCNVRDGGTEAREWTYRRKDGSAVPVLLTVSAIRDEQGALRGFLGVAVDLTAQRKIATELEELNRLLEVRSEQAESASQAKSIFVASMSHEIRTPMNAISGATFLLDRTELTAAQRDLLATVRSASKALLGMLNDVLDLSKIEADQLAIIAHPFRLRATLADVEAMLAGLARDKALTFRVSVEEFIDEHWIGDNTRLAQILTNLLGNAIKFTAKGEVALDVSRSPTSDTALRFVVRDTGRGIPEDAIPQLFTPFFQVRQRTSTPTGTGLGLAIVRHLTRIMGGTITVESELARGTTFTVDLPFERDLDAQTAARASLPPQDSTAHRNDGPRLTGCSALVVDDHPTNLKIARALLEAEGASVATAGGGVEALRLLRAEPQRFQLVLMDVQMPEMSGIEATRALREDARFAELPIIALTAGAMEQERRDAEEAGMSGFVTKPVDPDALVSLLREKLRRSRSLPRMHPQTSDASAPWPTIDGVAIDEAHRRFGGHFEVFRSLLDAMLESAADPRASIRAPDERELRAIARDMHRLRGAAASLGANDLAREARAVEHAANASDTAIALDGLRAVARELDRLRRASARLARNNPSAPAPPSGVDHPMLARLEALLRANDLDAMPLYRSMQPAIDALLAPERSAELRQSIDRLEFSTAAAIVASIAQS